MRDQRPGRFHTSGKIRTLLSNGEPALASQRSERPRQRRSIASGRKPSSIRDLLEQSHVAPVVLALSFLAPDEVVEPEEGYPGAAIRSALGARG